MSDLSSPPSNISNSPPSAANDEAPRLTKVKRITVTRGGKKRKFDESVVQQAPAKKQATRQAARKETVIKTERGVEVQDREVRSSTKLPISKPSKRKKEVTVKEEIVVELEEGKTPQVTKVKKKRKTKEEKEAEVMPLATRTVGSKLCVGAHVSAAGGVHSAVTNSIIIGANAFALFLRSQRKWANPPLADEHCQSFLSGCKEHKIDAASNVVPHGSYLVNLAHTDGERSKQAFETFQDDLRRCHKLGIKLYNFHPGNSAGADSREEAMRHIAFQLNKAHADPESGTVVTLLETMATRGNTIGGTFEDIHTVIQDVEQKDRVGVCLDTCHIFAAGYDIRSAESLSDTLDTFDRVIGLEYLRALHVNDSKAPLGSNRDLHANIGTGFLGLRGFHALVNERRLWGLPMILETPIDVKDENGKETADKSIWAREIKLLEKLVGMNLGSDEFIQMEAELSKKGATERARIEDQVVRKQEKDLKAKNSPRKKKTAAKLKHESDDSEGSSL